MIFSKICPVCGHEFKAQKVSTQFCSHACASRAYKARKRNIKLQESDDIFNKTKTEMMKRDFSQREVLSPSQAAKFLSVSRNTLYRYLHSGVIPCIKLSGLTRIRKEDLSLLFTGDVPFIGERFNSLENDINSYITVSQISIEYGLSHSATYNILRASDAEGRRYRGVDYFDKNVVSELFEKFKENRHPEITSWYTCKEIQKKYKMSENAVYIMAHDNDIPRKTSGRTVYYSKKHVDDIRHKIDISNEIPVSKLYYSVQMVMEEYGMSEGQVLNFLRRFKIKKERLGKVIRFRKDDFNRIFDAPPFSL